MKTEDLRYLFGKKTTSIIIATNPITYILLLMVCVYIPFYFLWKLLRLNDLWFIVFKIRTLNEFELNNVSVALERRIKNDRKSKWVTYIDRVALKKITNKINEL